MKSITANNGGNTTTTAGATHSRPASAQHHPMGNLLRLQPMILTSMMSFASCCERASRTSTVPHPGRQKQRQLRSPEAPVRPFVRSFVRLFVCSKRESKQTNSIGHRSPPSVTYVNGSTYCPLRTARPWTCRWGHRGRVGEKEVVRSVLLPANHPPAVPQCVSNLATRVLAYTRPSQHACTSVYAFLAEVLLVLIRQCRRTLFSFASTYCVSDFPHHFFLSS